MDIQVVKPNNLSKTQIDRISILAGLGFGQGNTERMRQDTLDHVAACDELQIVHDSDKLIAFSMVRRCLWQQGN